MSRNISVVFFISLLPAAYLLSEDRTSLDPVIRAQRAIQSVNIHIAREEVNKFHDAEVRHYGEMVYNVFELDVGPTLLGDLSTIEMLNDTVFNVTRYRAYNTTVYEYNLFLGLRSLFLDYSFQIRTFGFSWPYTGFEMDCLKNVAEVHAVVIVEDDGECDVYVGNTDILSVTSFQVTIQPWSYFIQLFITPTIGFTADVVMWFGKHEVKSMLQNLFSDYLPQTVFKELVCLHFVDSE